MVNVKRKESSHRLYQPYCTSPGPPKETPEVTVRCHLSLVKGQSSPICSHQLKWSSNQFPRDCRKLAELRTGQCVPHAWGHWDRSEEGNFLLLHWVTASLLLHFTSGLRLPLPDRPTTSPGHFLTLWWWSSTFPSSFIAEMELWDMRHHKKVRCIRWSIVVKLS